MGLREGGVYRESERESVCEKGSEWGEEGERGRGCVPGGLEVDPRAHTLAHADLREGARRGRDVDRLWRLRTSPSLVNSRLLTKPVSVNLWRRTNHLSLDRQTTNPELVDRG